MAQPHGRNNRNVYRKQENYGGAPAQDSIWTVRPAKVAHMANRIASHRLELSLNLRSVVPQEMTNHNGKRPQSRGTGADAG